MSKYKITINGKEYEMDVELMDGSAPAVKAPVQAKPVSAPAAPKAAPVAQSDFTPEIAESIIKASATSASQWFIPPLQDFLYMDKSLWLEKATDERINIPGTVTAFNWTYRLPCTVEELCANNDLIEKIKRI